jgi:ubiquinone/menaquinone biosynthesis C-methylase UbiE
MVDRSNERASREGVASRVEFRVADAQNLPFDEASFDVVLCESVATFVRDRQRVASECARVTRPGGYVGFNEEVWVKTPPPAELVAFVRRTWEIEADVPTPEDWQGFLEAAGLKDIVVRTYTIEARRESSQVRRYRFGDMAGMLLRSLALGFRNPAFRKYMGERRRVPHNLFEYLGYGVFVGRKSG